VYTAHCVHCVANGTYTVHQATLCTYILQLRLTGVLADVQEAESMFKRRPFAGGCEQGRKALQDDSLYSKRIEIWWEIDQKWCECRIPSHGLVILCPGLTISVGGNFLLPNAIVVAVAIAVDVTCLDP
jgi:hypothetical protein